jgi:hypothetical protein
VQSGRCALQSARPCRIRPHGSDRPAQAAPSPPTPDGLLPPRWSAESAPAATRPETHGCPRGSRVAPAQSTAQWRRTWVRFRADSVKSGVPPPCPFPAANRGCNRPAADTKCVAPPGCGAPSDLPAHPNESPPPHARWAPPPPPASWGTPRATHETLEKSSHPRCAARGCSESAPPAAPCAAPTGQHHTALPTAPESPQLARLVSPSALFSWHACVDNGDEICISAEIVLIIPPWASVRATSCRRQVAGTP